mgnify:CR=1 FL=1
MLATAKDDPALERPSRGVQATGKAVSPEPSGGEIHNLPVRGNRKLRKLLAAS